MKRNVVIIGTGYVGLTTGACLAYLGHEVVCVDTDKKKIKRLQQYRTPFFEPGLDELLKQYKKNITFTLDLKNAMQEGEIVFLCVGTPIKKDGTCDMSQFERAIEELIPLLRGSEVIVNKSTVPVGTGAEVQQKLKKAKKDECSIVSNPEFLREGSAVHDFLSPDRIVIGTVNKEAVSIMRDLYSSIRSPILVTTTKAAEMIKYASNAFLATKISFINEIANLCEDLDVDIDQVAQGVGMDKRIGGAFLQAGIGYGGSCFPKDIEGLLSITKSAPLLSSVVKVNANQQKRFLSKIKHALKTSGGNTVCVWGLSFKPHTDDVRKSPALAIVGELQAADVSVRAYDPAAMENAKKALGKKNILFLKSAMEAARQADVVVLMTEWPEFSKVDLKTLKKTMRHPYIVDGRNQLNSETARSVGFVYEGIGRR